MSDLFPEITAENLIKHLNLDPHPEGGWYRRTYRSKEYLKSGALPGRFGEDRAISTAIVYLLRHGEFSTFHRIKSDECWHFYAGDAVFIHVIKEDGEYLQVRLGNNIWQGENFQYVEPAGAWFAVEPAPGTSFALTGCTVAPGFDFRDLEMGDKRALSSLFPQHEEIINRLCRK